MTTHDRSSFARRLALVAAGCLAVYVLTYGLARATHQLVRYESGCVVRGGLDGRGRDYWGWPFRCDELRAYLAPDVWEGAFRPLVALEE